MNAKRIVMPLVAASAALVLSACGTTTADPAASAGAGNGNHGGVHNDAGGAGDEGAAAHNDADVAFVQGMIPHHAQAVEMSELAAQRAGSQQVKDLAETIAQAQGPEIEQMQGYLSSWGLPAAPMTGMGGMDHSEHGGMGGGMSGMAGMMSPEQMQQLQTASGAGFDRMFLQMMIEHHTGAIQMAETVLREGQNAEVQALAKRIIDAQRAEIEQMKGMLDGA